MKTLFTNLFRIRFLALFLTLVSWFSAMTQNVPEYMYFKFDVAGNQTNYASAPVGTNPATLTGLTIGSTGQFGTALVGNYTANNYLNTGWATSLPSTGWTISVWLNNISSANASPNYLFGDVNATSFRCFSDGAALPNNLLLRGGGLTDVTVTGVAPGAHVVTFVYTGTAIRYFLNGVFVASVTQPTVTITGTGPFTIGAYDGSAGMPVNGLMDEFRMYNRALSDAEVTLTWNSSLPLSAAPICVTTAASAITSNSATLNGTVNANGANATVTFDYGLTTAYGTTVPGVPSSVSGTSATPVTAAIAGLLPNTLYHCRVNGVNANGTTNGNDITFTTTSLPPTVVTTAATGIGLTTATLNGTVNANGTSTTVTFQYGLTIGYGSTVSGVPATVTGSVVTPVTAAIAGLTQNTLYHCRIVGVSAGGTSNGNDITFTTAGPPIVVTLPASNVSQTSAQLNGTVNANNLSSTVSFNWGLTPAYGNVITGVPSPVTGNTATPVLANITGLTNNVQYHFQVCATNAAGSICGADQTFLTGCPAPGTPGTISGPTSVCQGGTGYIYSVPPIPNATSYSWTLPVGGSITNGAGTNTITVTYSPTALYGFVTVAGVGTCGTGPIGSLTINVYSPPLPTITGPAITCQGSTNNVYYTQFGFSNYVWIANGGTITSGQGTYTVTVTWNTSGAQSLSVNYNNLNGCPGLAPTVYNVTVNASPTPTITGPNSLCANSGSSTYTTQAGFTNYTWTVSSGGTIISGQGTNTLIVSWNSAGSQTVTVNYNNASGCSALTPGSYAVTVNPLPNPAGAITGTPTVCGGATGVNYSVAQITNAIAYVWTLPPGATIASGNGTNSISVNFASNATSGSITVNGNNLCGNGNPSPPYDVTVNPLPDPAGAISGSASVCIGASGVIYSVVPIANATGYTWTVPAGASITSGSNTSSITVSFGPTAVSGNITVMGTNACGNGVVSPNFAVLVSPIPPAPVIMINGSALSSNAPSGNQWYMDNVAIPGATGQNYTPTQTGHYWDVVTLNTCSSDTSNHIYYVMTGINDQTDGGIISVYPNPSDGMFTLVISSKTMKSANISVINNLGLTIYESNDIQVNGKFSKNLDLRSAPEGVYSIILKNNETQVVKKIIVNK